MKTKKLIERLSLFLLALVLTMPTWAQGNEMIIASKADWGKFCDRVVRGETTLNAKMTADVDLALPGATPAPSTDRGIRSR